MQTFLLIELNQSKCNTPVTDVCNTIVGQKEASSVPLLVLAN